MDGPDEATRHLAEAHDGWGTRDAFERTGTDLGTGGIHLDLGQLDTAVRTLQSIAARRERLIPLAVALSDR